MLFSFIADIKELKEEVAELKKDNAYIKTMFRIPVGKTKPIPKYLRTLKTLESLGGQARFGTIVSNAVYDGKKPLRRKKIEIQSHLSYLIKKNEIEFTRHKKYRVKTKMFIKS